MTRIFALLALLATPANADPDRISVLLGSHHAGANMHFEESNPGLFLTWESGRLDWSIGAYRNSYGRGSVAVFAGLPILSKGKVEVSLLAGLALYPKDGRHFPIHVGDVVPLGGIQLRAGNVFMQAMPAGGKVADAIITMGLTFPLN